MSRVGKFGRIIIKAPGESGTLLSSRAWDQVMEVDRMIQDIVVEHEGAEYRYRDVCARWGGQCRSVASPVKTKKMPTLIRDKNCARLPFCNTLSNFKSEETSRILKNSVGFPLYTTQRDYTVSNAFSWKILQNHFRS